MPLILLLLWSVTYLFSLLCNENNILINFVNCMYNQMHKYNVLCTYSLQWLQMLRFFHNNFLFHKVLYIVLSVAYNNK